MKPLRLPEPQSVPARMPEIFEGGVNVVRRAIVIGNGFSGAESQCLGLVRALGLSDRLSIYRVNRPVGGVNEWLHWLPISWHLIIHEILRQILGQSKIGLALRGKRVSPFSLESSGEIGLTSILSDSRKIASYASDSFHKLGPTLVVACGRDTISTSSSIKRFASDSVFVIQIQHPRTKLSRFDMVVTPRHDYYALTASGQQEIPRFLKRWITPQEPPGRNVVLTTGALHGADPVTLRVAALEWHDELAPLNKPLLVVNIGGPTQNCKYGVDLAEQLVASLQNAMKTCGSVRISFSRRTPKKLSDIIIKELGNHPKVFIWDGQEPNPHMGHLAWGDAFVITADSISMLSEACTTGKPVYVIGAEHCKWKFTAFHKTLRERGLLRPFTGLEDISNSWSYPPLNDTVEVAARVREFLTERGWSLGN